MNTRRSESGWHASPLTNAETEGLRPRLRFLLRGRFVVRLA
jgi:hypothetical protein